ncbi:aminotransferase class V-fold PLP-dependent enzyme [Kineococcus xinjiangensis]|uniref:aminotransferase class V-fold PLP-dependent enzyme n=1 Tax=Kineococcus xinjiangensis TaxID=512762 RepID=UPI000CECC505
MTAPFDVARARRETPGCAHVAHLDNAGAALPPAVVTEAVVAHLRREARTGGYAAAAAAAGDVERTYTAIARLLGCAPEEIALTDSATRAWQVAFHGLVFRSGQRILTGRAEYASNVISLLQVAARSGVRIEVVDDDEHGQLDVADLRRRLDDDVALVAVTHVPTSGGLVNPVADVGRACREAGTLFLLDACQSVGQMPVDVAEIGCDFLAATGRKFLRAPRGTGFLYASPRTRHVEPPFLDLRSAELAAPDRYVVRGDARRFETWESDVAGRIGLGVAVEHALGWGLDVIRDRVQELAAGLRARLLERPGTAVHDQGVRRCGIVTFTVDGVPAAQVQGELSAAGVNTSVAAAASARLDLGSRGLPDVVRASVHYYNDEEDVERLLAALPAAR